MGWQGSTPRNKAKGKKNQVWGGAHMYRHWLVGPRAGTDYSPSPGWQVTGSWGNKCWEQAIGHMRNWANKGRITKARSLSWRGKLQSCLRKHTDKYKSTDMYFLLPSSNFSLLKRARAPWETDGSRFGSGKSQSQPGICGCVRKL